MQRLTSRPCATRSSLSPFKRLALCVGIGLAFQLAHADEAADIQNLITANQTTEAIQRADQYLASKPRDPMVRFLRGVALTQAGRTSEAITAFTKLTEDYPELPEPFNNLAVLYAQQGQYDKARTALEMAIRTNPSYATAFENLGDVYAKLASQSYAKALQIDPRSSVAPKLAMIRDLFPKEHASDMVASTTDLPITVNPAPASVKATAKPAAPAASSKPAAPVKPVAAAAAKPATPTTSAGKDEAADSSAQREVEAAVRSWASAWSAKDMDSYLASYARDYPAGHSRKAWEKERHDRIMGKDKITVQLSDLKITVKGDHATAHFRQYYKAGSLVSNSHKTLDLVRSGNSWLIVKESVGS
jgi:ketosteroid isomerase-like protein